MITIGLRFLFLLGVVIGVVLAPLIFVWALLKKARPIHFDGAVCEAELVPAESGIGRTPGEKLRGAAIARLSGGGGKENSTGKDVLGFSVRCQAGAFSDDLTVGDQDLVFGTFESFLSLPFTVKHVKVGDYLANEYSSVTHWRIPELGTVKLRALPPRAEVSEAATDRLARLDADLAAGTAVFRIVAVRRGERVDVASLRLVRRLPSDGKALHISMFRNGRGFHPTGARNGIRAVVYPVSQFARGLRSG